MSEITPSEIKPSEMFEFPSPIPMHRLNVHDSLTINAERWLLAHNYHRQKQSLLYQSLAQPGIVYGLGVKVIEPPAETRFKDQRWLEVQPGMAIDYQGNFIIVSPDQDRTYRLAVPAPQQEPTTVYLIVKYVDPEGLELSGQREQVPEQFRLDETTQLPNPNAGEIELCRIHLELGDVQLEMPEQPMQPQSGAPNLLHRSPTKVRSQGHLRVGLLPPQPNRTQKNFEYLAAALPALYPALHSSIDTIADFSALSRYGLIYLQGTQLSALGNSGQQALQQYVAAGGTLLFEADGAQQSSDYEHAIAQLWPHIRLQQPPCDHTLKTTPFLFGQLPSVLGQDLPNEAIQQEEIQLLESDGIVFLTRPLSAQWGPAGNIESLPRQDIRAAHELGINLLTFAWQRQQLYQCLQ